MARRDQVLHRDEVRVVHLEFLRDHNLVLVGNCEDLAQQCGRLMDARKRATPLIPGLHDTHPSASLAKQIDY